MEITIETIGVGAIVAVLAHTATLGYFGGSIRQILRDYGRRLSDLEKVVQLRRTDD